MPIRSSSRVRRRFVAAMWQSQIGKRATPCSSIDGMGSNRSASTMCQLRVVPALTRMSGTADGSATWSDLRGLREILVYQAAQHLATIDKERQGSDDRLVAGHRHAEFEAAVGPVLVVVPDVLPQNPCQVMAAKDE